MKVSTKMTVQSILILFRKNATSSKSRFIGELTSNVVYDNGCNLMQFCFSRLDLTKRKKVFEDKSFVVDRLHITGHTDEFCRDVCHPDKVSSMKGVINTIANKQIQTLDVIKKSLNI